MLTTCMVYFFLSSYFQPISTFKYKVHLLYIAYSWVTLFYSDNLCLLLEIFNLFMFNEIIGMVVFGCIIRLFVFYLFFLFPVLPFMPFKNYINILKI